MSDGDEEREMERMDDDANALTGQESPKSSDGQRSPRSPRGKKQRRSMVPGKEKAAQAAMMIGSGDQGEDTNLEVHAEKMLKSNFQVNDDDDWSPLESWKPGDYAFVSTDQQLVIDAFISSEIEFEEEVIISLLGEIGRVGQVISESQLELTFNQTTNIFPISTLKKTLLVPLIIQQHDTAESLGLSARETTHGGIQILGAEEGSIAWKAGLGGFYGWWLTHVGKKRVTAISDIDNVEGEDIRLEKRVTLPFIFALSNLEEKVEGAVLSSDLRVYVAFVAMFIAFFIVDRNVESAFYITQNMRGAVLGNEIPVLYDDDTGIGCTDGHSLQPVRWEKTYTDLANVGDWNAWIVHMALPTIWHISQFGRSVSSNILLGGVRFRTLRVRNDSCTVNHDIIPNIPELQKEQACYAGYSSGTESKGLPGQESAEFLSNFNPLPWDPVYGYSEIPWDPVNIPSYRSCSDSVPETSWSPPLTSGQITFYHCGGYLFEIPFMINGTWNSGENATNSYKKRACQGFVDDVATRLVAMELYEYSPTFDTFLSARIFFEVAAGGAWIPTDQLRTFTLWTEARVGQTALDIVFFMFILYYIGDFVADARRQSRRNRPLLRHFLNPWTILEFLNMILFLVSFGFRFAWYARSGEADIKIDHLAKSGRYPGILDQIEWLYMIQVYINSCNVVLTFLKLLKFLRLNKRMNILTATLSDCQDSIIGVLLIFILVVLAFAVTGNTLFGTQMYEYRTLSASFSTLMRMLMGEFDYEAMKRENRVLAGMFFWGFIILGLFILLNFLIGVISESFGNVSGRTVPEPLDRLLDKAQEDFKVLFKLDVMRKWFLMRVVRCTTRESLLERCIDVVQLWRDENYVQEEGEDGEMYYKEGEEPEDQTITRHEFLGAISTVNDGQILEDLGVDYARYIWNHLVYEFHRSQEAEQLQGAMRRQAAFERGCKTALADKIKIVDQFSQRMDNLNSVLDHMKSVLDRV